MMLAPCERAFSCTVAPHAITRFTTFLQLAKRRQSSFHAQRTMDKQATNLWVHGRRFVYIGITHRSVCSRENMGLHYVQSHPGLGFECRNYSNMFRTYENLQGHRASRSCECYWTRMCSYVDYSSCFPLIFGV
jgi:hypothetical protein